MMQQVDASQEECGMFLEQLTEQQLLISSLEANITGEDYLVRLLRLCQEHQVNTPRTKSLNSLLSEYKAIQQTQARAAAAQLLLPEKDSLPAEATLYANLDKGSAAGNLNFFSMKTKALIILSTLLILLSVSCKKKDVAPIEELPHLTHEGKNTFGCLVNGKVFKPKGSMFSGPNLESYYQYVDGEYYFYVSASDKSQGDNRFNVNINTNALSVEEGIVLPLVEGDIGEASVAYLTSSTNSSRNDYRTNEFVNGKLIITHFDLEKQIVSGAFWFDAVNAKG